MNTGRFFLVTRRVHGSAFHGDRCTTCSVVYANFADGSECLTGDNVSNEAVTIHRLQEVLKMLPFLHVDIFRNCFFKKTQAQQSFLHLYDIRHQLSLDGFSNCVSVHALDFDTPVSWARRFSDFRGECSSWAPRSSNISSASARRLCFVFLSSKRPVVLSLFTKLRRLFKMFCPTFFYQDIFI
jgi:hypothetical protein